MVVQVSDYTQNHWGVHFKWVNCTVRRLYLDKAVTEKEREKKEKRRRRGGGGRWRGTGEGGRRKRRRGEEEEGAERGRPSSTLWWKVPLSVLFLPVPLSLWDLCHSIRPSSILPLFPYCNNDQSSQLLRADHVPRTAQSILRLISWWGHLLTKLTNRGHLLPQDRTLEGLGYILASYSYFQAPLPACPLYKPGHPLISSPPSLFLCVTYQPAGSPPTPAFLQNVHTWLIHEVFPHTLPCSPFIDFHTQAEDLSACSSWTTSARTDASSTLPFSQPEVRPHLDLAILHICSTPDIPDSRHPSPI